jgi:hypothetical protein
MTSGTTVTLGNATLLNNGFLGSTSNAILSNDFNAVITNYGEITSTGGSGDAISNSGFAGVFGNDLPDQLRLDHGRRFGDPRA